MFAYNPTLIEWALLIFGSVCIGVSKTSINAAGGLVTPLYALLFSGDVTTAAGVIVPLLIVGDIQAILYYRTHVQWHSILLLLPWVVVGVLLGHFMERIIPLESLRVVVGVILLIIISLSFVKLDVEHSRKSFLSIPVGIITGNISMLTNAGGTVTSIYFLLMNMKKMTFAGSAAGFFLCMNSIKLLFRLSSNTVNVQSLSLGLWLVPGVVVGALLGKIMLRHIPERIFRVLVRILALITTLQLFFL